MIKACLISSTRADFGLLKNLVIKLKNDKRFSLKVIASGSHFSKNHGYTLNDFKKNNLQVDASIKCVFKTDNALNISKIMSKTITETTKILQKFKPKILIVLGDRYEILASVISAQFLRIPVAHLHGGEITFGALDDAFRHSITKMSHIHFVANKKYKNRIIQLGEKSKNIHVVGGLGADSLNKIKYHSKKYLAKKFKVKFLQKNFMVCFHPETINKNSTKNHIKIILSALSRLKNTSLIFTMPGADLENGIIASEIKKFVEKKNFAYFFKSLGDENYYSFLSHSDGIIGNSSSGILEMPYFKKGTINLGQRQLGRLFSNSIQNSKINSNEIIRKINFITTNKFTKKLKKNITFPYGKSGASKKIVSILKRQNFNNLFKKKFEDITFN